jgi:hypothetical protein
MATFSEIEDAIRQWVIDSSSLPGNKVIFTHEDLNRPTGLHYQINTQIMIDTVGQQPYQRVNPTTEFIELHTIEKFMVIVYCYGRQQNLTAFQSLRATMAKIKLPSVRQCFRAVELAMLRHEAVLDISYFQDRKYRLSAQCEILFNIKNLVIEDTGVFDTIVIDTNDTTVGDLTITSVITP